MAAKKPDTPWGYATDGDDLYLLPVPVIEQLARLEEVTSCTTWGDVAELGDDILEKVLGLAGYGTLEEYTAHLAITGSVPLPGAVEMAAADFDPDAAVPSPEDEFDIESIPAYCDGDFPPDPRLLMSQYVPDSLIRDFGREYTTIFNGDFAVLESARQEDILTRCATLGIEATHSADLKSVIDSISLR